MQKNRHKIVYEKKLCNIKKNPRYVAGESNFEYTFKISDRSVKICLSCFRPVQKKWFREKRVQSFN